MQKNFAGYDNAGTAAAISANAFLAKGDLADKASNGNVAGGQAILIEGVSYEAEAVMAAAGDADTDADILEFFTNGPTNGAADLDEAGEIAADGVDGTRFTASASGQIAERVNLQNKLVNSFMQPVRECTIH